MALTDQLELEWTLAKENGKRLTRVDTLMKTRGITREEARELQNEYHTRHQERVRGPVVKQSLTTKEEEVKPKKKWWESLIDLWGLGIGVTVSLILNVVVFWVLSPDWVTGIGMVCLAPVVVLFSVRGWIMGGIPGKALWTMFFIVESFSGISFALASTDLQAKTGAVDTELVRLTSKVTHDQTALDELLKEYKDVGTGFRGELTVRDKPITDARIDLKASEQARKDYLASKAGEGKHGAVLTSDKLFTAIPDALTSGRWIQAVFFTLIFTGLALTIVSAATSTVRKGEE